jgi:hypothetical protein
VIFWLSYCYLNSKVQMYGRYITFCRALVHSQHAIIQLLHFSQFLFCCKSCVILDLDTVTPYLISKIKYPRFGAKYIYCPTILWRLSIKLSQLFPKCAPQIPSVPRPVLKGPRIQFYNGYFEDNFFNLLIKGIIFVKNKRETSLIGDMFISYDN